MTGMFVHIYARNFHSLQETRVVISSTIHIHMVYTSKQGIITETKQQPPYKNAEVPIKAVIKHRVRFSA